MKINIETKNIVLTQAIKNLIRERIDPLEKFIKVAQGKDYSSPSSGKIKETPVAWVEVGKETLHHKKGPFFRAECQIRFFGKSVRAEAVSKDLRMAITKVKDELQRELKKIKGKLISRKKRKSRTFKKEIKLSPLIKRVDGEVIEED